MANYQVVPVRAFADNYIWTIRDATHAAVVDPGDAAPVLDYLRRERLELVAILNTHHHADHVGGNSEILRLHKVPVWGPLDTRIPEISQAMGHGDKAVLPHFGIEFEVFEIPAHTRTHIAFHGGGMVFCGDTLFAAGCGRLFEGTPEQMHKALTLLGNLAGDTKVYCGHEYTLSNIGFAKAAEPGNQELMALASRCRALVDKNQPTLPSTISQEKATNPFMRCNVAEVVASASRQAGRPLQGEVAVLGALREWKNNF